MQRTDQAVSQTIRQVLHESAASIRSVSTSTGIPRRRLKKKLAGTARTGFNFSEVHKICRHVGVKTSEVLTRSGT
ncbi:helix-turn-helix domain-containing protein [Rhodococcus sp. NPDC019627]|uniref:helix-turn-helix domain-containing protein n=1 Tax=unclassified Rhodococcus (in: high G+C Gram-positive bacteria) TaxID=192944 RepID=UPI0033FA9841